MVITAFLAAILVAAASYHLGTRQAESDVRERFIAIRATLADAKFPLNELVIDSLAELARVGLITLDESGAVKHGTVPLDDRTLPDTTASNSQSDVPRILNRSVSITGRRYFIASFPTTRSGARADGVAAVGVLFDQVEVDASRRRAAVIPLITGLSTIVALSSLTLVLSSRLVTRISRLQRSVEAVAAGDFDSTVSDQVADEVGQLGGAVDDMARQLDGLWKTVQRQQGERVLHQIASGMAHQVRNSLTGARMAVELHKRDCKHDSDEDLSVAIHQIELSEDYVRRLLLLASGEQDEDRPQSVSECCEDVRTSLSALAKHLDIDVKWNIAAEIDHHIVRDGPRWTAAVTNLIHNAMDAGKIVRVDVSAPEQNRAAVRVRDNGDGIPDKLTNELFEPFVTSKPEGMGLGLSLVRRAAEYFNGSVVHRRNDGWTQFDFEFEVTS